MSIFIEMHLIWTKLRGKQSLLIKNCRLFDVQETINYADLDRRAVQELKEDTDLDKSAVQIFMKVAIIATTNPFELPHLAKFRVLSSQQQYKSTRAGAFVLIIYLSSGHGLSLAALSCWACVLEKITVPSGQP